LLDWKNGLLTMRPASVPVSEDSEEAHLPSMATSNAMISFEK